MNNLKVALVAVAPDLGTAEDLVIEDREAAQ